MAKSKTFVTRRSHKTTVRYDREPKKMPQQGPDPSDYTAKGNKTVSAIERDTLWIQATRLRLITGSYRLRDLPSILMLYATQALIFPLLLYGYVAGHLTDTAYLVVIGAAFVFMSALTKSLF